MRARLGFWLQLEVMTNHRFFKVVAIVQDFAPTNGILSPMLDVLYNGYLLFFSGETAQCI